MLMCQFYNCFWIRIMKFPLRNHLRWKSVDVLHQLVERGLIKEIFPKTTLFSNTHFPCAYAGFDATSDSLHIGNLLVLMALFHWQRSGNQAIIVIGDTTAQIGDPSGHSKDRKCLNESTVYFNSTSIEHKLLKICQNHEFMFLENKQKQLNPLKPIKILRNSSWYRKMNIVDFLSLGRHLRVSDMLSRSSVKTRLESGEGMRFSEFSYQLFQSYDWMHLLQDYNCIIQFGGNDQMGNIVSGYNFISECQNKTVHGALLPLIESETGDKYGKSSGNAIYLSEDKTSPFELYQFFTRLPDLHIEKYLKLFTFYSLMEIEEINFHHMKSPEKRIGQMKIAETVTFLLHGEKGLMRAREATKVIYNCDYNLLSRCSINELREVLPQSCIVELILEANISVMDVSLKAGCFLNKADAVRIISSGGVHVNLQRITSPSITFSQKEHIFPNGTTVIRVGKKNFYLVVWKQ